MRGLMRSQGALSHSPAYPSAPARYVVAGDVVHHLFVGDFTKEYPNAKLIGVEGLPEKRPELKWDGGECGDTAWMSHDRALHAHPGTASIWKGP